MNLLFRLKPYIWPNRHRVLLSFVFAALVAVFWGANLSIAIPVVKVLIERESLGAYVSGRIEASQGEIASLREELRKLSIQAEQPLTAKESLKVVSRQARFDGKLANANRALAFWGWVNLYVIKYVPVDKFETLTLILGGLIVLTALKLLCMLAEDVLVGSVAQLTVIRLRAECFRRVLNLDYQTLTRLGTPNLVSRFTYDLETLYQGLSLMGGKIVREPLKAIVCVILAFWLNWQLTLMSLVLVPFGLLAFNRIGRWMKKASHLAMDSMARIYKVLEETLISTKVVIAFDGAAHHRRQHHLANKAYYEKSMRFVFFDALTSPVSEFFGLLAVTLAVLPGCYLVLRNTTEIWNIQLAPSEIGVSELTGLYVLLAGILDPVRKLSSVFSKMKRATAAADRIFELLNQKSQVIDPPHPQAFPAKIEMFEFRGITFSYTQEQSRGKVLDNVTLQIKPGEVVAVVGENGSGKSTLVNLLPRYFDPQMGGVLVNGLDLREFRLQDLRSRIGVVTQETVLFDDTIYENIRYGKRDADASAISLAAEQAHVAQFMDQLPAGLQTRVGERGGLLSGGQRQRIALARAMLRNPDILILDEATSAIDAQSEVLIHKALKSFVHGRTTFLITHAVTSSVLDLVTKIVVMDRGQVAAVGTHAELLANCPLYHRLCHARSDRAAA